MSASIAFPDSIVRVAIEALVPYARNARTHSEEQVEQLAASMREFGWTNPVLIDEGLEIVAGHGRVLAAKKLGLPDVPCIELRGLSAAQKRALRLADNALPERAAWDLELVKAELTELQGLGFDLALTGFELPDVRSLLRAPGKTDADDAPEPPVDPVSQPGDLWLLGAHRLLCGDSTKAEDVARVMAGEKAVLLATDPPYLVDYTGGNHPQSWANKAEVKDKHWDAYVDPTTGEAFFTSYLRVALAHCIETVPVYQWHATRRQALVERAWRENGLLVHQTIIWVKARPILTRSHYMWKHEPCFYGWREGHVPPAGRRPPPNERTVWDVDQVGEQDGIHPTQKPVELFDRPLRYHTREGEVALEPFSGSGSQIVAAERLGRRCFALEISPAFVDVAVRRWEAFSGQAAVLEGDGRPFAEVAAARGKAGA